MLAARLVICEHTETVLHREDLVVNATVIAVLIAEVVEALSKLSDVLILLGGSDLDSRSL